MTGRRGRQGFARAQGLPRLRSSALRGLQATATLGRSSFASSDRTVRIRAEVVDTSQRTAPIGAAVPIEFLEHYGRELAGGPPDWSSAVLELEADGDLDSVRAAVRAEGLRFEDAGGLGALRDALRLVARLGTAAVSLVCLGVVALVLLVLLGRLEGRARLLDSLELAGLPRKSLVRLALWDGLLVTVPMLGVAAAAGGLLGRAVEWLLVGRLASELGLDPSGLFAPPGPGLLLLGVVLLLLPPIGLGLRCRLRLRRPLVERLDGR